MRRFFSMLCGLVIVAPAMCAPITYDVHLSGNDSDVHGLSGSVVGTITTDGAQGLIGHADILDFSILITLGSTSAMLTPANSAALVYEFPLIANQAGLFDSSSPSGNTDFGIVNTPQPGMNAFDLSSPYFEDAELSIKVDGVLDFFHIPPSANYEALLATPEVPVDGVVPEPDEIALLLIGGTAFGTAVRRKVRRLGSPR